MDGTICLSDANKVNDLVTLEPCGHVFHKDRIAKWVGQTRMGERACPSCRVNISNAQVKILEADYESKSIAAIVQELNIYMDALQARTNNIHRTLQQAQQAQQAQIRPTQAVPDVERVALPPPPQPRPRARPHPNSPMDMLYFAVRNIIMSPFERLR